MKTKAIILNTLEMCSYSKTFFLIFLPKIVLDNIGNGLKCGTVCGQVVRIGDVDPVPQ